MNLQALVQSLEVGQPVAAANLTMFPLLVPGQPGGDAEPGYGGVPYLTLAEALAAALPKGCLLVLDEAYFEYADDPDYPDGIDLVRRGAPVVVTRTFSKVYGLGGLRAGYAVAAPQVLEALLVIREAFGTNSVAQAAATAALGDVEHVRRSVEMNRAEKARLAGALRDRGFVVLPSLGNFVTFDTRAEGRDVFRRLLSRAVIVRPLDPYDMKSWLRVSVGTPPENAAFLAALDAVLPGKG